MVLTVVGLSAVALGFFLNWRAAGDARVSAISGSSGSADKTLMWVVFGVAALCLIGAAIAWFTRAAPAGTGKASSLVPGWYDDPESSLHLRYWDGQLWTEKTVEKPSG